MVVATHVGLDVGDIMLSSSSLVEAVTCVWAVAEAVWTGLSMLAVIGIAFQTASQVPQCVTDL